MKTKKNALLLSLIFLSVLPSSYGIEPWEVINSCVGLASQPRVAGNVLSYKNKFNQTIVLRSGRSFSDVMPVAIPGDGTCIITPIEDVVGLTTNTEMLCSNTYSVFELQIQKAPRRFMDSFLTICENENNSWKTYVMGLGAPTLNFQELLQYCHTEIQVQALYNAWNNAVAGSDLKNKLEALVPVLLVPDDRRPALEGRPPVDQKIYSLFEACHACEKTAWLNQPGSILKNNFYFRVLDRQYTFSGKYKVSDAYLERAEYPRGFMSQSNLEGIIVPSDGRQFKVIAQSPNHSGITDAFLSSQNFSRLQTAH